MPAALVGIYFFHMGNILNNKNLWIILLVVAILVYLIYRYGKKQGALIPLPNNGSGIPQGWSPVESVEALYAAMDGFGTDEEAIWTTLTGKTHDQLAAIYNEYLNRYGHTLFEDFRSDLSGDDLARALQFFNGVV